MPNPDPLLRARVALIPCPSYALDEVRAALSRALAEIPEAEAVFAPGKTVLLKPNLLSSTHPPEDAVNTHPAVVRALAEHAVGRGASVIIGDSCGSLSKDSTRRAIEISGVAEVGRDTGAEIVNFDTVPWVEIRPPNPVVLRSFRVPKVAAEADAVVSVPKFKTHGLTTLTGAVKNLFGLVPGKGKKDVHVAAPKPDRMAAALVDILSAMPPALSVMDAVVGMEGEGPAGGTPRQVGCLLAGADAVAVDAVAAALMGVAPQTVATLAQAAERGLGVCELGRIDVAVGAVAALRPEKWRLPGGGALRKLAWKVMPERFAAWAFEQAGSRRAAILPRKCKRCGLCAQNCPVGAVAESNGAFRVEAQKCIACHCCAEVCPYDAVEMRAGFVGEALRKASCLLRRKK